MEKDPKGTNSTLGGCALSMIGFFGGIAVWGIYGWKYGLTGILMMTVGILIQKHGHRKNEQI